MLTESEIPEFAEEIRKLKDIGITEPASYDYRLFSGLVLSELIGVSLPSYADSFFESGDAERLVPLIGRELFDKAHAINKKWYDNLPDSPIKRLGSGYK